MSVEQDLLMPGEDVHADDGGARVVVRISRTATGTRTYTVGLSVPLAELGTGTARGRALGVLWDVERRVRDELAEPATVNVLGTATGNGGGDGKVHLAAQLQVKAEPDGWHTTSELLAATGWRRGRLLYHLDKLVREGKVEKDSGPGGRGRDSRYRLTPTKARRRK